MNRAPAPSAPVRFRDYRVLGADGAWVGVDPRRLHRAAVLLLEGLLAEACADKQRCLTEALRALTDDAFIEGVRRKTGVDLGECNERAS